MTDVSNHSPGSADEEAYNNLRRLIPQLAEELDGLRASLREHNVWLQRYGSAPEAPHTIFSSVSPYNPAVATAAHSSTRQPTSSSRNDDASSSGSSSKSPPNYLATSTSTSAGQAPIDTTSDLPPPRCPTALPVLPVSSSAGPPAPPGYGTASSSSSQADLHPLVNTPQPPTYPAASSSSTQQVASVPEIDGPPSYGNTSPPPPPFLPPPPNREEMAERRDQTAEWLREGEDVLREYSARFAQLGAQLRRPFEDVLGSWQGSHPDNALPDYERVEEREELMVGGVGEVPPPYVGGATEARGIAALDTENGDSGDTDEDEDEDEDRVEHMENVEYGDDRDVINAARRIQATREVLVENNVQENHIGGSIHD